MQRAFFFPLIIFSAIAALLLGSISDRPLASSTSMMTAINAAQWGGNVEIHAQNNTFTLISNGIPNHERQAEYIVPNRGVMIPEPDSAHVTADPTVAQDYNFTIPLQPNKSTTPTSTSLGPIGVMISGAVLFNPYEADNRTIAKASNFTLKGSNGEDVPFLDRCNGHPTPRGMYHYHALPSCITQTVDQEGGASHLIGIAFDGFPIYGDRTLNGNKIQPSQLDACNGITSPTPEFPNGIYHYVLLDAQDSTSSIRCFSGQVSRNLSAFIQQNQMPGMMPMTYVATQPTAKEPSS